MHSRVLVLAVAAALSPVASAQSADADRLDEVVVTATRTATTVNDALAPVEVIDRAEIERSQAHSVPELLRGRAGITLVNQGGRGKVSTLFLRGAESDHVLVLVDGVRVGSATSGLVSLQDLPMAQIERVEIVRGPRSSLYGSDAIGGVIQVFTRRGAPGTHPRLAAGVGSHGLREASAGIGLRSQRGWFDVDGSWQHDDGIDACRGIGAPLFAGCGTGAPDPDRDGYRSRALSLRAGLTPGEAWTIEGNALRNEGRNEYDANPDFGLPDSSDTVQQVVGGKLRYAPSGDLALQLSAGRNLDASKNYLQGVYSDRFSSTRDSAGLQADLTLAEGHRLTAGLDWLRDRGAVRSAFAAYERARGNRAGFVQYQGRFGAHDLQAALRHDDNDQFGGHDTGSLAWGRDFAHDLRLTASVGTAFKAPTFNELYYPFYGNPDLAPETSRSLEAGIGQRRDGWHWRLDAFQTDIDALISYDSTAFRAENIDRARIRGAELAAGATVAGWRVEAQASLADPRNLSDGYDGRLLPRRVRRAARVDVDRAFGKFGLGATWIAEGERPDDALNVLRVGGYATLDLRARYALTPDWTVQAQVRNAFDRDYETVAYYNQPGREFGLTVRYAPR
ncbi:MAG TPA: TonB-dependent vitamin B12 receptor [Xanthomonadaceae bacterium]|nr:TonB-dependent vitamin B12 receptor [Xanthomonadaceae bacterium]